MARNYCSSQLYTWFTTDFKDFDYDLVIYNFNENNPRRSITFHESGKPVNLTQPVITYTNNQLNYIDPPHIGSNDDMCYLDSEYNIKLIKSTRDNSLFNKLKNSIHIFQLLDDLVVGDLKMRKYKNKSEIKDIEKWSISSINTPYHWMLFSSIMVKFINSIKPKVPFMIIPNLQYYHAGNNWLITQTSHSLGHKFEKIPSRKYLNELSQRTKAIFCDIYEYVLIKLIPLSFIFILDIPNIVKRALNFTLISSLTLKNPLLE